MQKKTSKNQNKIDKIAVTTDKISGRGGLALFLRYAEQTGIYNLIENELGIKLNKSRKGLQLIEFIKQMFAYFIDGTHMSIENFNKQKADNAYAALLENDEDDMATSHQIKRFFAKFRTENIEREAFRKILYCMFLWRLELEKPEVIVLGIDTMVMDNDSAQKREGSKVTYKKTKGFQPLHISWGSYLIDVLFRKGDCHSNHGTDFIDSITEITNIIRKYYKPDVPIILVGDSGFMDNKAFTNFETELNIGYIITGKMYGDIKTYISKIPSESLNEFKGSGIWNYLELGNKLKSWDEFRRTIFTTLTTSENGQLLLEFARPDTILYTNLGKHTKLTEQLKAHKQTKYLEAETIISLAHQRGKDELIHRSIKEMATKEQLPFKCFKMNEAYYYLLTFSHFLFETYKRDVTSEVLPFVSYPNTFRRKVIDFAVKIVKHGGSVIIKVSQTIHDKLNINKLWQLCQSPPPIPIY